MPSKTDRNIKIFLSAGEVSGDLIGASLTSALQDVCPGVSIWGIGGTRMEKAGVSILYKTNHMGAVGISEPMVTIPHVFRSFNRIRSYVAESRPDVAVLIGYDFFNLVLSRWLRTKKVLTVSYFPPQIWIWKGIAAIIARSYDWILTSFEKEELTYHEAGGQTAFVGHYLRDRIETIYPTQRDEARKSLGLGNGRCVVGLLPGSRRHELERMTPVLLDVARHILSRDSDAEFVIPIADTCFEMGLKYQIRKAGLNRCIHLSNDSRTAMPACDMVILCSGTATLEAALMGLPMIILYQVSLSTWITVDLLEMTGLIESKTVGLPNLLAGKKIVPEFIQSEVVPAEVANEAWDILQDSARQDRMKQALASVCSALGEKGGIERAARLILERAIQRRRRRGQ
ncbi:MAG: lipid-A-disaccharide synthase [Deltaproteobacteria bacterium]|nr:lipid-A-disaccharide synthase [Deltaproteobacteria bacterium]